MEKEKETRVRTPGEFLQALLFGFKDKFKSDIIVAIAYREGKLEIASTATSQEETFAFIDAVNKQINKDKPEPKKKTHRDKNGVVIL